MSGRGLVVVGVVAFVVVATLLEEALLLVGGTLVFLVVVVGAAVVEGSTGTKLSSLAAVRFATCKHTHITVPY
jgi:hypothetical protein